MLGLHHRPEAGAGDDGRSINICGLGEAAGRNLHRHWGVMYQNGALFSRKLTVIVIENIEMPMAEYLRLPEDVVHELAMIKLSMVGLPDSAANKFPAELSGGMVKRAGLARALALDPQLLFLDEPTSGLDPIAADAFDRLILGLRSQLDLTVVMVTHDLDTLFNTCDRIGVLVDQKMIQGKPVDIMHNPHPWIQEYFGGARAQRALAKASYLKNQLESADMERRVNYLLVGIILAGAGGGDHRLCPVGASARRRQVAYLVCYLFRSGGQRPRARRQRALLRR